MSAAPAEPQAQIAERARLESLLRGQQDTSGDTAPAFDSIADRIHAATNWRENMVSARWPAHMRVHLASIAQAGSGLNAILRLLAMSELERDIRGDSDNGEDGDPLSRPMVGGLLDAALILSNHVGDAFEHLARGSNEAG